MVGTRDVRLDRVELPIGQLLRAAELYVPRVPVGVTLLERDVVVVDQVTFVPV